MYYFSSFKTIFIVCFGVILFIFSHSSISSPITDYELSIGNLFKLIHNEDDSWDLKLMDVGDRNPSESWEDFAKDMIEFMDRLPEKKIRIISLGKYHSKLFLTIGKDTSADNKWDQMVLRLNTKVVDVSQRGIFDSSFKNALKGITSDFAAQGHEFYNKILDRLKEGKEPELASKVCSDWMNCSKGLTSLVGVNAKLLRLNSDKFISGLTAKGIDELVEEQGIKDEVIDITLLDRLSSFLILKSLPRYFLKEEDSTEGALSHKGSMGKNMFRSTEIMLPLLYLTPEGSLIPEIAEYNVQIRGRVAEVNANVSPENKLLRGEQIKTVKDYLSVPVNARYTLAEMTGLTHSKENQAPLATKELQQNY